jgi:hypothetical protein
LVVELGAVVLDPLIGPGPQLVGVPGALLCDLSPAAGVGGGGGVGFGALGRSSRLGGRVTLTRIASCASLDLPCGSATVENSGE